MNSLAREGHWWKSGAVHYRDLHAVVLWSATSLWLEWTVENIAGSFSGMILIKPAGMDKLMHNDHHPNTVTRATRRLLPVSYTHLDVYKRQLLWRINRHLLERKDQ